MADEQKAPEAAAGGGGMKKLLRSVGLIVGVIVVASVGGIAAFIFVLKPMLQADASAEAMIPDDLIPMTAVEVSFETNFVNLIMPDENMPTSTLLYTVTLSCANQVTADIISAHMARFSDTITKLHDGHLRADVMTDPRVLKESIQKQVVQECNRLLERLSPGEEEEPLEVLAALHTQFAVSDNI